MWVKLLYIAFFFFCTFCLAYVPCHPMDTWRTQRSFKCLKLHKSLSIYIGFLCSKKLVSELVNKWYRISDYRAITKAYWLVLDIYTGVCVLFLSLFRCLSLMSLCSSVPVTMDPNTGSVCLAVSPDLSSVFVCEEQPLPDNPERFVSPQSILGSEGFSSGRHSWEVEVGDNSQWSLGVASESVHRKDWSNSDVNPSPALDSDIDPGGGLWTVSCSSGEFWASSGHSAPLRLRRRPTRVRIQLDWERGCLTFSDANDNTLIYRFKKQWSGILRPYFSTTCSKHPLKITAGRVTVNIE